MSVFAPYSCSFSHLVAASQSHSCRPVRSSYWCRSARSHHCCPHTSVILKGMSQVCHGNPGKALELDWIAEERGLTYLSFLLAQRTVCALYGRCPRSTFFSCVDSSGWKSTHASTQRTVIHQQFYIRWIFSSPLCRRLFRNRTGRRHSGGGPHRNPRWTWRRWRGSDRWVTHRSLPYQ